MGLNEDIKLMADSVSYEIPSNYISGRITEYDIKSANISMLKKYNMISDDEYNYYLSLPKQFREQDIGKMIRDRGICFYNTIAEGIKDAKYQFLTRNNIDPMSIVRIANDAVYVNSFIDCTDLQIYDTVKFVPKNVYNVMIRLNNEVSIYLNIEKDFIIDVIGINNDLLNLHEPFMEFLCNLIYQIERVSIESAITYFNGFYKSYINKELDIEYYREFNSYSMYRHISGKYLLASIKDIKDVDTNYNLYILRNIFSILVSKVNLK